MNDSKRVRCGRKLNVKILWRDDLKLQIVDIFPKNSKNQSSIKHEIGSKRLERR